MWIMVAGLYHSIWWIGSTVWSEILLILVLKTKLNQYACRTLTAMVLSNLRLFQHSSFLQHYQKLVLYFFGSVEFHWISHWLVTCSEDVNSWLIDIILPFDFSSAPTIAFLPSSPLFEAYTGNNLNWGFPFWLNACKTKAFFYWSIYLRVPSEQTSREFLILKNCYSHICWNCLTNVEK